ncbi:MAG: OsmC family protein [Candidatus Heimdallarchaeota archaeon]|nr:OsmC family protein [Candidatus Heimdallarchaeota archaeon]
MEIISKWMEKNRFKVSNGKHPEIFLDTPSKFGGEDTAPTALELAVMALAGCLGTTFKITADHMRLEIDSLEVKALANKSDDLHLSSIHLSVNVDSNEPNEKLIHCLELAEKNCPVDIIFQQTTIPIEVHLNQLNN